MEIKFLIVMFCSIVVVFFYGLYFFERLEVVGFYEVFELFKFL